MFSFTIRGKEYKAATLAGISAAYCKARDESGEGASTFPFPDIVGTDEKTGKKTIVARLSYNGRVWPNVEYDRRIVPLYDPAADPAPAMLAAIQAISARIRGEFDHPALLSLGPLSTEKLDDLLRIAESAITAAAESATN